MVCRIERNEWSKVQACIQFVPALGARIEVDWMLVGENRKLPYQFYFVGENAVLEVSGSNAMLCGEPGDEEELESFFAFTGITRLTSMGWKPKKWCGAESKILFRSPNKPRIADAEPKNLDSFPSMKDVLAVLESTDGRIVPETARDGFYADVCTRRNHGYADVVGIRKQGILVSTAGAYCITPAQAYIACVETIPTERKQGYAKSLVAYLCERYKNKCITLLCEQNIVTYYEKLGFELLDTIAIISHEPI